MNERIDEEELMFREQYYNNSIQILTREHHKPPTIIETIMYMGMMLKEDPIELAIKAYQLEELEAQKQTYNQQLFDTDMPF